MTLSERIAQITLIIAILAACYFIFAYAQGSISIGNTIVNTGSTLNDGLVAHYTFDGPDVNLGSSTAEVLDRSGNNNYGNMLSFASESSALVLGRIGQAMDFDGDDDYIEVGLDSSLNDVFVGGGTLAAWIYPRSHGNNGYGRILAKSDPAYEGWQFFIDEPKNEALSFHFGCSSGGMVWWKTDSGVVPLNEWSHVAVEFDSDDGNNTPNFYVNGELVGRDNPSSCSGDFIHDNPETLLIGERANAARAFDGYMDDVRIYDREVTASEIRQLYNLGVGSKMNVTAEENDSSLIGHWTFDGPDVDWGDTGSEIKDRSGQNNHGNAVNLGQSEVTNGVIGQALDFTNDNKYIGITSFEEDLESGEYTWTAWAYPTLKSGDDGTVIGQSGSNGDGNELKYDAGTDYWQFSVKDGEDTYRYARYTQESVELNKWYYLVAVRDNEGVKIYVDGILGGRADSAVGSVSIDNSTSIGRYNWTGGHNYFGGKIDDVRIYDRALSAGEVARLYRQGGGVVINADALVEEEPEPEFVCGTDTVEDVDGNTYDTVQIGGQCWMAENMRVGTTVNVSTAQTDNSTIERWCYNNDDANCDTNNNPNNPDGGLYQWNEAMQYSTTEGAQGICPDGWHIPTDGEYKTLEMHLGMSQVEADSTGYRGTDEGTKLKPNGSSGFEGNLAGYGTSGSFFNRGSFGFFWSSSESGSDAWRRGLFSGSAQVNRNTFDQTFGYSVRCVQD